MRCPRCEQDTLDEREREGVVIDVCKACRGIWLDRGELEKLVARTTSDIDDHDRRTRGRDYDDHRRKYPRKKSLFESLGDIFD